MLTLTVKLTQEHLKCGTPGMSMLCPWARAINAALAATGHTWHAKVCSSYAYLYSNREPLWNEAPVMEARLPEAVRQSVHWIDRDVDVALIEVTLAFETPKEMNDRWKACHVQDN